MKKFTADLQIIGANPFVFVPAAVLASIFKTAGREKGPIPVSGAINDMPYKQTLVRYRGEWRLYINTAMLKNSPKRIGEKIRVAISVDATDRSIQPHPKLVSALNANPTARKVFDSLRPSLQHEIIRYIHNLKTPESIERNIARAVAFLLGKERFIGRDRP
ncbi:MAG: YdeI/OmpD-associated family protein [Chitinophagaceae bacterium]